MLLATAQAIIAEARSRQQHGLADRMESTLREAVPNVQPLMTQSSSDLSVVEQSCPIVRREDLIFPSAIWRDYDELLQENQRRELLRSYGLEPRHRILLAGGPGTGKTSLAALLATDLMVPLLHVNYAALFGSLLGETSQQLQRVMEFAAGRECVLLLDEFDSLGKTRDDPNDAGEVKRILNFLLVRLEMLPSHVVVVGATNRPESLDGAVWRRFQKFISLPDVTSETLDQWIERADKRSIEPFGISHTAIKRYLVNLSFAELEMTFQDIQRHYVLSLPNASMRGVVSQRLRRRGSQGRVGSARIKKTASKKVTSTN
jgi:SpoVK/Ycf46/Vps4 family AAA+-type ATPase